MTTPYAANVLSVYYRATPTARAEGFAWYRDAHDLARSLDPLNPARGAGVIAALSPLTPWPRNIFLAMTAYSNGGLDGGTLGASVRKVNAMLREDASPFDVLTSQKVGNFFRNILHPESPNNLTIDAHAYDIAVGRPGKYGSQRMTKRVYAEFVSAYVEAAKVAGVMPLDMQAITWVQWRNDKKEGMFNVS